MTMPVEPDQSQPQAAPAEAPANAPANQAPANQAPAPEAATPPAASAPTWDGDFDPERAARLVENLRAESKQHKEALAKAQARIAEFEQAQMTEQEKIAHRAETAEKQLADAHRRLAVLTHQLPESAVRFLTATTPEEIEAQAKELAEAFPAPADSSSTSLPPTMPIPGNGSDPANAAQLTREQFDALSPAERMRAYREGRTRNIGGR
jgi:hypothetical protein